MAITTSMTGAEIDKVLKSFLTVMSDENANGNILFIRNGDLSYADGDAFFDVSSLEEE